MTWQTAEKFTDRVLPPGSWPCPVQGCHAVFAAKSKLELHTRVVHMHVSNSCASLGYFKPIGTPISVPPNPLPEGVLQSYLSFCPQHFVFSNACTVCVKKAHKRKGPVPPFRFFDGVELDMKVKRQVVDNISARKADSIVKLECGSWMVGLVVTIPVASNPKAGAGGDDSKKVFVDMKCRIVSALLDRNEDCWLEVEFLYTHKEVLARGWTPPGEHEQRRELFRPTSIQGATGVGKWIQIDRVQNVFGLRLCNSVEDMHSYLDDPTESKVTSFFVRNW